MPVLESVKEEKDAISGQPVKGTSALDIENALSFLDSEEYKEVRQPVLHEKDDLKRHGAGEKRHNTSKPLTSEIDSVKFSKQKDSTNRTTRRGEASHPPPIEKKPVITTSGRPLDGPKGKKPGKKWLVCLGTAALILLAILVLYQMGYLFAGA